MAELSSLGSVVRQALVNLSGSQRLPLDAVDGAAEQVAAAILAANQAVGIATDAKAASVPTPPTGTPSDYVLRADKTYAAQGMPSAGQIRDALADLPEADQLGAEAIQPAPGYALVQVALSGLTKGSTFQLKVEDSGRVVLASAASVTANPNLPAQMVVGTHFVVPAWIEDSTDIQINVTTPPSSTQPVTAYVISIDGSALQVTIPASTAMPYALDVTPDLYPELWQWGASSWVANVRIAAVSSAGQGLASAPQSVTISQSASFFWPDADWTFAEERDFTASGNIAGKPKVSLSPTHSVPPGWALYSYMGSLPYVATNYTAVQAAAQPIAPAGSAIGSTGSSIGSTVYGILLYKRDGAQLWKPASAQKNFTVQGVIPPGAPVALTPPSISGTGKIGSALSLVAPTWSGSPTSTAIQWLNGGAAISGATGTSYTPVATDDLDDISVRVIATNAGGSTIEVSTPVTVTYPAPTVATAITSKSFSQQSGAYRTVDISGLFSGSGLTITVAGPSVGGVPICAVNPDDLTLGVNVSSVLAPTTIPLTARNSGGSISSTFSLTIAATGTAVVPDVISPIGGSVTAGEVAYTNYLADDMILALIVRYSSAGFTKPDLAAWTGQYDWNKEWPTAAGDYASTSGMSVGLYWRRCNGNGTDGTLGDWGDGRPTYITIRGVNWADPAGAVAMAFKSGGIDLDHPGLTLEGVSSIVLDLATIASAVTGQAAGLRPDVTSLVQTSTGTRRTIARSTTNPVTAWAAANDVEHTVTTKSDGTAAVSGAQCVGAIEIKGAAAVSTVFPAAIDASKVTITEVTDPAEASANGFTNTSGRLKTVIASDLALTATTTSGTFSLVFELASGENPAPPATGKTFTAGTYTYYTLTSLAVGTYAYPRLWWRLGTGASAQYKLAWSGTPFEIEGLTGNTSTGLPQPTMVGTGNNQLLSNVTGKTTIFYPAPRYTIPDSADWGKTSSTEPGYDYAVPTGQRGEAGWVAAYAALSGLSALEAMALAHLRAGLVSGQEPSFGGGYSAQHHLAWVTLAYFVRKNAKLWGQLTSTEKTKVTLLVKAALVLFGATRRENGDSNKTMFGMSNVTTVVANTNVGSSPRYGVMAAVAFLGGVSTAQTFMKSLDTAAKVDAFRTDLVNAGLVNPAAALQATGRTNGLTQAQVASRISGTWTSRGVALTNPTGIYTAELNFSCSRVCKTRVPSRATGYGKGEGKVLHTATTALTALANAAAVGMLDEFETFDQSDGYNVNGVYDRVGSQGDRSSAEYGMKAMRVLIQGQAVGLHSGLIDKTNAAYIAAFAKFKICMSFFREITRDSCGWQSYAQAGHKQSGPWTISEHTSGDHIEQWGILPFLDMGDVCIALMEGSATRYASSYYWN